MGKFFSWGKIAVVTVFSTVAFLGWKSAQLEAVQINQKSFEDTQSRFSARMDGYDRELENVRIESKLNSGLLKDGQQRLIRIEQLLLEKK